jgi:hypothetical protein
MIGVRVIALLAFLAGCCSALLVNLLVLLMMRKINSASPDSRVSWFGFNRTSIVRVFGEYRRLFPAGRLHLYVFAAGGLAVLSMFILVASVEMGSR